MGNRVFRQTKNQSSLSVSLRVSLSVSLPLKSLCGGVLALTQANHRSRLSDSGTTKEFSDDAGFLWESPSQAIMESVVVRSAHVDERPTVAQHM